MPPAAVTGRTFTRAAYTADTPQIRAWFADFRQGLIDAGLVQTTEPNQIDLNTVSRTSWADYGYQVWRLNDALQATKPVFIRFNFMTNATASPFVEVTVGTATDGNGNVTSAPNTGASATARRLAIAAPESSATYSTTARLCFAYGDKSGVLIGMNPVWGDSSAFAGGYFWCERTRDLDGTPNGDGFVVQWLPMTSSTPNYPFIQLVVHGAVPPQPAALQYKGLVPALNPSNAITSGIRGGKVHVAPVLLPPVPGLGGVSNLLVSPYRTDYPVGGTFDLMHYGTLRTFTHLGPPLDTYLTMDGTVKHGYAVRTT